MIDKKENKQQHEKHKENTGFMRRIRRRQEERTGIKRRRRINRRIKIIRRNQMGGREKNLMGNELKEGVSMEMDPNVNCKVRSTCLTSDK